MGSTGHDASSFLNNVESADQSNIVSTLVGGAIFNLANLLLVAAIDMAGLAFAFPISIGIALVVGVLLSYSLEQKGNPMFLGIGVLCALIAVILDGKAYGNLPSTGRKFSRKSLITCVVSGILMGLWNPFMTYAMTRGNSLTPYSAAVFLTLGALLSCFIWNLYFMKHPLVGEPVRLGGFFRGWPFVRPSGRSDLGNWYSFQPHRRETHRASDLLCHRPVCADGRSIVGSPGVEGIRRLGNSRQDVPGAYVRFLWTGDFTGRARQWLTLLFSLDAADKQLQEAIRIGGKADSRIRLQLHHAINFIMIAVQHIVLV